MSLISYKINEQNGKSADNGLKGMSDPETDKPFFKGVYKTLLTFFLHLNKL